MCAILVKLGDEESFDKILSLITYSIQNKVELYNKNPTQHNYFLIKNYVIFFMIITINLKKYPSFIKKIFKGETKFFTNLNKLIAKIQKTEIKQELTAILNYLFLEEYKDLYFRKDKQEKELEEIFIEQQSSLSSVDIKDLSNYDQAAYKKMINILLTFNISYDNFFQIHHNIKDEERPEYKLKIAQSIIRVAFSKEKTNFTDVKYYEYIFIKRVIDKDMEETRKKFGDEYKTLFRKEDLCDDVIKYMFFIFGNSMMIESFVKPVKKMLKKIGINEEAKKADDKNSVGKTTGRDINVEEYNILFNEIYKGLVDNTPHVIRILLKLLYSSIRNVFTIDEDNYYPLYTALIFNFIISPRVQMLYSMNPTRLTFLRSLNRLIRNTCFNFKFDEKDSLAKCNESIEENNKKLKSFIEEKIISINENDDDVKNSLRDLFTEKNIIYPKFLFYVDSELLCGTITGGEEEIIHYHEM